MGFQSQRRHLPLRPAASGYLAAVPLGQHVGASVLTLAPPVGGGTALWPYLHLPDNGVREAPAPGTGLFPPGLPKPPGAAHV